MSEQPSPLVEALRVQERAWGRRPLVRALYEEWYRAIAARLSTVSGGSVELGSGIATLQRVCPSVRPTDIEPTPWTDEVVDAEALPFADGSLANLVLVDVFHHLSSPAAFLDEAGRALAPGGRVVILDPYCSLVSTPMYRRFHHERTDLGVDPFGDDESIAADPLASNQARATLVFFRHVDELARRWPQLSLVERIRLACLAYPLSGGLTGRRLVPHRVGSVLQRLDRRLSLLGGLLAFRCIVVLERRRSA